MSIYMEFERLIKYGLNHNLFEYEDICYIRNSLIELFELDEYILENDVSYTSNLEDIINNLLNYAYDMGILESNTSVYRDLLDTKIMSLLIPRPSEVIREFNIRYKEDRVSATNYLYNLSKACDYVRTNRIKENITWKTNTEYGDIDITINLSKPEKDPKAIAKAKFLKESSYPMCLLCKENVGYKEVEKQIADIDTRLAEATKQANALERKCETLAATLEAKEKEFWSSGGDLSRNRDAIKLEMQRISSEVERVQEEIMHLAMDASTPLFLCRDLVTQSYNNELSSQQSEAKLYSDRIIMDLHQQILERLVECGLSQTDLRIVQDIINDVLVGHVPESATKETVKKMSGTSMMLYQRLIAEVFQNITQRIDTLVNHVEAQESEWMSLDAHLEAADEKTLAMQLFDALKSIEAEKALADAEYLRQRESIESLKRQRELLKEKRIQLIKAIAEKEHANDDNARIVKYAAMSIEVLREFKVRLQREKVAKLSSTATYCFRELVEKDSLVSEIKIDPSTLDVTIIDLDGNELLKSQLSAGEQQMFAVAIVWALALTSGYKAPVIVDTPMARLDSSHRANFVTKYLPAASSQVLVLSTDEEVYGRYLDLVRDNVVDYYTLLYREEEQCTSIVHGYFGEV